MAKKKKSLADELLEEPLVKSNTTKSDTKKVSVANTPKQRVTNTFEEIAPIRKTQNNLMSRDEVLSPLNIGKQKKIIQTAMNREKPEDNSSFFGTTANVLKTFGQGMMKAEESIFIDTPSALISKALLGGSRVTSRVASIFDDDLASKILIKGTQASNKLNEIAEQDWTANALDYYGWNKKLDNGKTVAETLESKSAITSNDILGKAVEGLGGMTPTILMGGLLGGSTAGVQTAQELEKVKKLQNVVSYSSLGARSFGGAYEQALQSGATPDQAMAYGISSSAVEIGTEWLSGGVPGVKGTVGGGLDEAFGKYVLKEGVEETSKSLSKAITKSLYKTSMEGVEEMISETLEPYIKQFTYEYDESKSLGENFNEASKKVSFQDIMEAGVVGSLTAVLLGDVDISDMKTGYQNTQAINNTITNEIQTQQNMLGRELTKEESNAIKTEIKDHANNVNQYGEEIANRIIDVKNNNTSTEGLDLEQSYKAYNGKKENTKIVQSIQKAMDNRGIDARFDATRFGDDTTTPSFWEIKDGKESVIYNPNANIKDVIQDASIHELSHSIFHQNTDTSNSLKTELLNHIKETMDYESIKQQKANDYKEAYKDAEDFDARIDEEIVADYLGTNLGTQEYVNRLINEKPSMARRIYDWVKDKLSTIGMSEEDKAIRNYWKDVADKFEIAYNEQTENTENINDKREMTIKRPDIIQDYDAITKENFNATQKDIILNDINEIDDYVDKAYKKQDLDKTLHYGVLKEDIVNKIRDNIQNKPNNNWDLKSKNYDLAIRNDSFLHLSDGKSGITIEDVKDFVRNAPDIIANFDSVEYSKNGTDEGLRFTKKIDDNKYVSFSLVSDKKNRFLIKSISFDKETYKNRSISPTANDNSLAKTSKTDGASASSENIIAKSVNDVKYKLSPKGEMVDNNGNKVTLEASEVETSIPIRDDAKLMAIHNLNEDKFNGVLDLGGFPVPSIAITNPGTINHNQFGEISILFDKSTIDPSNKLNEVYDRDVWSPRFPNISREIIDEQIDKVANKIGMSESSLESLAEEYNNPNDLAYRLSRDLDVIEKYIEDNDIKYNEGDNLRKIAEENGIIDYISKQIEGIYGEKGIYNGKSYLTDSGRRRSFWELHDKYNLENVVKNMISQKTVGTESNIFGTGFGQIQANQSNQFKSIEEIKSKQDNIKEHTVVEQEIQPIVDEFNNEMAELTQLYASFDPFWDMDSINYQLLEFSKADETSAKKFYEIANKYNPTLAKADKQLVDRIVDTMNKLKSIPSDYFEAKPQRAVGLDEIQMAVIPNTASQELKQRLQDNGIKYTEYDPSIEGDRNRVVNQFSDLKFSMNQQNTFTPETEGTRTTYGELFDRNIAPIREDLSNITEQMNNLSNQIETLQNQFETTPQGYVETYNEQRNENIPTRNLTEADANTLQDALMQDEGYLRSLDEQANQTTNNTQLIDRLTNNVTQRLDLDRGQRETLRNIINDSIEKGYSADELSYALYKEFSESSYEMTNQEAVDARRLIRDMPIKVSDSIKTDIADYGKWKQSNFGKINFSNSGIPVDSVYMELSEKMPYYFPSDIINPTEQLLQIAEVANMATKTTETFDIDPDEFDNIADYIVNTQLEDEYNSQMNSQYDLEKNIQFDMNEDIVPTTIRTQDSIDDYIDERDIAPVKPDRTQQRAENRLKRSNAWRSFREKITNRNAVIDDYAKATGNKQIKFTGDMLNSVSGEVQYNIYNRQTDINGKTIGKSINEIFEPSKKAGLYQVFNDYLFNKSNIERHRVGKGSQVPEAVSQQLVNQYEQQYPEVKKWAKDVYKYYDNVLQEQVNAGLITQEQYNNYRGENGIYRSYTPFYTDNIDSRYFDNEGKIKPVSTLKRSKGNASDVSQLLSMEDAMAKQTYAYKRAIRQNELFKEIVSASEKYSDAMDMDVRDNPTNLNDSLYTTPEGDKVVTAYINGEKVSAKISDELFNELSGDNEARIKQFEEDFSIVTNPLQRLSGVRRNLLTTWNPTFLARNAIKDIQDAVINSKHTAGMLKNYIPGIKELSSAKTQTAQQFLALYGADNLYGDYSNISKGKKAINKFVRLNELIELAPRFAEFKASLQAGDSVQEAIYNAREVTTNFGRGGYITKALNRNGFTFLNANVQGLSKLVRNLSGENGAKGVASVVVKGALFAVAPSILNHLLYGLDDDKDEEYEAIPDYIKDNYYLIKTEGNNFVRIPKGRINAVFGSLARRMIEAGEGEGFDFKEWGENAWNQIGVGDSSGIQTIFTPLRQAFGSKNGEAWYGGDIVPTRLQNKPAGEQTDAKIDAVSNFIGENLGISPYKINYVLDQYSGGLGDVLLPYITPETKNGAETFGEHLIAPIKDAFVVNSTDDNKYAGDFYDLKDKLEVQSNSEKATDDDKIKYKYMSEVSKKMGDLYKEKREVQADTTLGNKAKYEKVQKIQTEINSLAKEGLSTYQSANTTENYSEIGDTEYYKNAKNEWTKVNEDEQEFTAGLNTAEKDSYFKAKNKIYGITQEYSNKLKGLDKDDPSKSQIYADKKEDITKAIVNSGLDNQMKAMVYSKYYSNQDTMTNVVNAGYDVDTYITALNDIDQLRTKYSKKNGYTTEERKQKTIAYINSLNMEVPQKAMMIRNYYTSFRQYNNDIVNYVANLNISYEDKKAILEDTGMTVNGNSVSWK